MDEIVLKAMQKWPDVPNVFGWLRLDRRGRWLVKARSGEFGRIGNAAVSEFIGRNYACDDRGRWYFQNGPQRVFVALDYTPLVYRLDDSATALISHTGASAGRIEAVYLDECGALLVAAAAGMGVLHDRDLAPVVERLLADNPLLAGEDALAAAAASGISARVFGSDAPLRQVRARELPARFGFDPSPVPAPGQPEC